MTPDDILEPSNRARDRRFPASFFLSRWRGSVPLGHLFWRDMLIYGTAVNIVAALVAALLFVRNAPTVLAAGIFFAPLPYNLFLFAAVWKSAADTQEPWASAARIAGLLWLIVVTII